MRGLGLTWVLCWGSFLTSAPPLSAQTYPTPAQAVFSIALSGPHDADVEPRFAFDGHGNSIRVWTRATDSEQASDVVAQLVDAQGLSHGPVILVNSYTPNYQQSPAVAMNRRGLCVVVWQSSGQAGQISGVYAQIYGPAGTRVGGEITVSSVFPRQSAILPSVGIDRAGNFAVAWWNGQGAFVRRFDTHGVARGPELRLSPAPATSNPSLVMRPDGSFAVIWRSWRETGPGAEIFGRFFDPAGAPLGKEFQINETLIPNDGTPTAAATPDGGLVVAWDSCDFKHPSQGCAVRARRLTATGVPLSAELAVSPHDSRIHFYPAVAADGFGNSAVSWDNCLAAGSQLYDCGISVLFYDPQGTPSPQVWTLRDALGDLFDATVREQPGGFVVGFSASAGVYGLNFLFP